MVTQLKLQVEFEEFYMTKIPSQLKEYQLLEKDVRHLRSPSYRSQWSGISEDHVLDKLKPITT